MRKGPFDPYSSLETTGAQPVYRYEELLKAQFLAVRRILLRTYQFAEREAYFESSLDAREIPNYLNHQSTRHPSHVFLIDGARGAGKTTVVATLRELLPRLGTGSAPNRYSDDSGGNKILQEIEKKIRDNAKAPGVGRPITESGAEDTTAPSLYADKFGFSNAHEVKGRKRQTAVCLPILHPADLEQGQPILEGIFALLGQKIDERIKHNDGLAREDVRELFVALKKKLYEGVAKGWYLSRQDGVDAILRDSVDYEDFPEKKGRSSQDSHSRVKEWRAYVNEFLNAFDTQLLVVCLDDADNRSDVTMELLQTIRVFLDHPRIVTVLAGNLRAMRESLLMQEMTILSSAMPAMRRSTVTTQHDLRSFARRHTEEFLEKVLPRQYRCFLSLGPAGSGSDDDYKRILGLTFDDYCAKMSDVYREDYHRSRLSAQRRYEQSRRTLVEESDRYKLENFIAWWLLRFWYERELKPRSLRHLVALRDYTLTNPHSPALLDRLPTEHRKRLAVILFETPENHELIQRFGDTDDNVLRWLHKQQIASRWDSDRFFEVNGVPLFERSYSYQYILYRADLAMALPIPEKTDDQLPRGLLPKPAGANLIVEKPFFARMKRQSLIGVARQLNHSLIPSNCTLFFGLQSLPDIAWEAWKEGPGENRWSHQLIAEWPRLFFSRWPNA